MTATPPKTYPITAELQHLPRVTITDLKTRFDWCIDQARASPEGCLVTYRRLSTGVLLMAIKPDGSPWHGVP